MKTRLVHLDFLRGLAALLVCVEHLRAFLFLPFESVKTANLLVRGFYFVTGLGHQAVMIFFVMSGFLVGGSVISAHQKGQWSWTGYALRRLSRLWMVLLPALLLTLFWDKLGATQSLAGYQGAYRTQYHSGPMPEVPADLRPGTFLGNAVFLQTITVNCFGTNGPLWSLANEFWYYLLFPLLLGIIVKSEKLKTETLKSLALKHRTTEILKRGVYVGLFIAALYLLPRGILMGGLVWLMGAGVYAALQSPRFRPYAAHPLWLWLAGLLTLTLLAASRFGKLGGWDDLLLGTGVACLVAALAVRPCSSLAGAGADVRRTGEGCRGKANIQGDGQGEVSNSPSDLRPPWPVEAKLLHWAGFRSPVSDCRRYPLPTANFFQFQHFSVLAYSLYARLSAGLSEFSYTLYLVHFPVLAFLFFYGFNGHQLPPGIPAAGWFAAILTAVVIYAAGIYWCFERNTDRLRKRIEPFLIHRRMKRTAN